LNRLWIPNENIQKTIDYYLNEKFKSNYVIGIQFRTEFLKLHDKFDQAAQSLIDCALKIETNVQMKYDSIKWFVLSDDEHFLNNLSQKYKDKIIIANGTIGHIEQNENSYERVILDIELLSRCNDIIITRYSTFGFVASMKFHALNDLKKLPFYSPGAADKNDINYLKCQTLKLGYIFF